MGIVSGKHKSVNTGMRLATPASQTLLAGVVSDAAAAGIMSGSMVRMPQESTAAAQSRPQGDNGRNAAARQSIRGSRRWRRARRACRACRRNAWPRRKHFMTRKDQWLACSLPTCYEDQTTPRREQHAQACWRHRVRGSRRWRRAKEHDAHASVVHGRGGHHAQMEQLVRVEGQVELARPPALRRAQRVDRCAHLRRALAKVSCNAAHQACRALVLTCMLVVLPHGPSCSKALFARAEVRMLRYASTDHPHARASSPLNRARS